VKIASGIIYITGQNELTIALPRIKYLLTTTFTLMANLKSFSTTTNILLPLLKVKLY
jgi:hypothetical protein